MWNEPETEIFSVIYDGEIVKNHEIDAKLLATSLNGVASVLEESNKIVNGPHSHISVKIKGNFAPGSFLVEIVSLINPTTIDQAADIATILGLCGSGSTLIALYRLTK